MEFRKPFLNFVWLYLLVFPAFSDFRVYGGREGKTQCGLCAERTNKDKAKNKNVPSSKANGSRNPKATKKEQKPKSWSRRKTKL